MVEQRIAVIGSGAIGGVIAEAAHAAGHQVTMCVRTSFDRLTLDTPEGTRTIPVELATEPDELGAVDWAVLTTKVHDVPGAAGWLRALDDGRTPLVVVQNGVEHRRTVADYRGPVLPALIYVGAERVAPGQVVRRSPATVQIPNDELGTRFAGLLADSALRVRTTDDFHTAAWRKMLTNLAPNPITTLTLRRLDVLADPDVQELCAGVLAEAIEVARAEGARLDQSDADKTLRDYVELMPPTNGTSMLYDRIAGLPTEHEHITGTLVRAAHAHGIDVPLNRTLLTLLRALKPTPLPTP